MDWVLQVHLWLQAYRISDVACVSTPVFQFDKVSLRLGVAFKRKVSGATFEGFFMAAFTTFIDWCTWSNTSIF